MIQNIAKTKIIFFDIDGTLVSFKTHTIPQSTLDAIHSVREKGVKITMLRHVGIGVAMGNASDEVKAAADIVTTSVDDDGVANIINVTLNVCTTASCAANAISSKAVMPKPSMLITSGEKGRTWTLR